MKYGMAGTKGKDGNAFYSTSGTLSTTAGNTTTIAIANIQVATGKTLLVKNLIIDANGTYGYVSSISGSDAVITTLGSLRGADGTNGITPTITAGATIDSNVGTPSVSVVKTGTDAAPTLTFNFTNLKGEPGVSTIQTQIVNSLPATGDSGTIYFMPNNSLESNNVYDEYIWVNNDWEKVDSKIDLSNYIKKSNTSGLVKNDGSIDTSGYVRYDTNAQGLDNTQKSNARTNIGAGTSNFSGNYNDLTNKPKKHHLFIQVDEGNSNHDWNGRISAVIENYDSTPITTWQQIYDILIARTNTKLIVSGSLKSNRQITLSWLYAELISGDPTIVFAGMSVSSSYLDATSQFVSVLDNYTTIEDYIE